MHQPVGDTSPAGWFACARLDECVTCPMHVAHNKIVVTAARRPPVQHEDVPSRRGMTPAVSC